MSTPSVQPVQTTNEEFNRFQRSLLAQLNPFLARRILGATFVQVGAGSTFQASTGPFSSVLLLLLNGAALDASNWTASPTAGTVTIAGGIPVVASQLAALVQT